MASRIRSESLPVINDEYRYYCNIKNTLKAGTEDAISVAQRIFDEALDECVWTAPLGNMSCSYDSYVKSDGNYCVMAKKAIEAARAALSLRK